MGKLGFDFLTAATLLLHFRCSNLQIIKSGSDVCARQNRFYTVGPAGLEPATYGLKARSRLYCIAWAMADLDRWKALVSQLRVLPRLSRSPTVGLSQVSLILRY